MNHNYIIDKYPKLSEYEKYAIDPLKMQLLQHDYFTRRDYLRDYLISIYHIGNAHFKFLARVAQQG